HLRKHCYVRDKSTCCKTWVFIDDQITSIKQNDGYHNDPQKLRYRRCKLLAASHFTTNTGIIRILVVKTLLDKSRGVECLYNFDSREGFVEIANHLPVYGLRFRRLLLQTLYYLGDKESGNWYDKQREQGKFDRHHQQRKNLEQKLEGLFENDLEGGSNRELAYLHLRRYFRNDISLALIIEVSDVKIHDGIKHGAAEIQQSVNPQIFHDSLRKVTEYIAQQYRTDNDYTGDLQGTIIAVLNAELLSIVVKPVDDIQSIRFSQ